MDINAGLEDKKFQKSLNNYIKNAGKKVGKKSQ